jgi:hypothetical protein
VALEALGVEAHREGDAQRHPFAVHQRQYRVVSLPAETDV